jgi:protein-disulfide isomerase
MVECDFCDEDFDSEEELHVHWMEEHEDDLNSHQKDKAKKAKREREERKKIRKQQRKKYLYQGVGAAVVLLIAGVLGAQLIPSGGNTGAQEISVEGEPMLGDENASVTVVEFGDFECPACNRFEQGAFSRLKSEYIETGKVKFYWKDHPLDQIHPWARTGAQSMECVYREGGNEAFWNVKSKLFNNQGTLSMQNVEDEVVSWAEEEGVNGSNVRSCIQSGEANQEVTKDKQEGRTAGARGTPTIFVKGKKLSSFDYNTVSQAIDKELEN